MINYSAITTKAISIIGVFLMLLPIGLLTYEFIFPEGVAQADDFNVGKENEILLKPIFDKATSKFKDPFLSIDNKNLNEKPLQFTVPTETVSTTGAFVRIPSIGVDTNIYESYNTEEALEYGVWRDPKHGTPDTYDKPIVLGAHRWGHESLSWEHRTKHLFYKFDQLQVGATVEIIWNNKMYYFKVREVEQNYVVNDTADLIMYTCIYYGSPERYIVYADRV
jgi:sortase (surface protein transpeptidase)